MAMNEYHRSTQELSWFEFWAMMHRIPRWRAAEIWEDFYNSENENPIGADFSQKRFYAWWIRHKEKQGKPARKPRSVSYKLIDLMDDFLGKDEIAPLDAARIIKYIKNRTEKIA